MTLLRSVEGYYLPEAGERAVFWPHLDYTDVYAADGFSFDSIEDDLYGGEYVRPELILPR